MRAITRAVLIAGMVLAVGPRLIGQSEDEISMFSAQFSNVVSERGFLLGLKTTGHTPQIDNMGNMLLTYGTGAPHRLLIASIDTPHYVVSAITEDGYLLVQRLPQNPPNAVFDSLNFAQPILVETRSGKYLPGVFAGLSVHLQPNRKNGPKMNSPGEMFVDIGARNAAEVRAAGVDVLDRVDLDWSWKGQENKGQYASGSGVGDRFGALVLWEMLIKGSVGANAKSEPLFGKGTTTLAFVTQSWEGGRGLNRLLEEINADETIYIGRVVPTGSNASEGPAKNSEATSLFDHGVLMAISSDNQVLPEVAKQLQSVAAKDGIPVTTVSAQKPRLSGYARTSEFPGNFVQLGVETVWPETPAETVSARDVARLEKLLEGYLGISTEDRKFIPGGAPACKLAESCSGSTPTLRNLVLAYGASGHEQAVREEVKKLLPEWARSKATTDAAGNLVLYLGDGKRDDKTPRIAFVAHMDEIGYEVKKIEDDGRLQVDVLGGGYPQYFLGHAVLVHKKDGSNVGGVLELPTGWDKPGYEFPTSSRAMDEPAHVYLGTHAKEETERLGVAVGDFVTIPKEYRPLLGTRANARSFDDRVGCAALIEAVKALGPELPGRDVTFVWSTEEEVGLKGAAAFAEQAVKEGRVPDFVFAIDTFVSADSPLESKRFADAAIGNGFVVRAVDNSNIVPLKYVDRVVALAKENDISVQYGVTGGGNDGAVFTQYGSVDVALGWPLRYSHSPAEVIDTKDLDALGKIVEVLARKW